MSSTVTALMRDAIRRYEHLTKESEYPSAHARYQGELEKLLIEFEKLKTFAECVGLISASDESIEDLPTSSLPFLTIDFFLGEILNQRQRNAQSPPEHGNEQRSGGSWDSVSTAEREEDLALCLYRYESFYRLVVEQLKLFECGGSNALPCPHLSDVTGTAFTRTQKVELAKRAKAQEAHIQFLVRTHRLPAEFGAGTGSPHNSLNNVADDEEPEEEALLEYERTRLMLCVFRTLSAYRVAHEELEMLRALTQEQRRLAVEQHVAEQTRRVRQYEAYQEEQRIQALCRDTFGVEWGSLESIGAHNRQRMKDDAFQNRNAPTQTLEEFAEQEMAHMQEATEQQARAAEAETVRLAALTAEEREEEERQEASRWQDWKDDHPPIGKTRKGNYS